MGFYGTKTVGTHRRDRKQHANFKPKLFTYDIYHVYQFKYKQIEVSSSWKINAIIVFVSQTNLSCRLVVGTKLYYSDLSYINLLTIVINLQIFINIPRLSKFGLLIM